MPAKSKSQQSAAALALKAKRGEFPKSKLKGAARQMYDDMTEEELDDFASTSRKDLPDKIEEEKFFEVSEDVEVILDGVKYLLESGDKVIFVGSD